MADQSLALVVRFPPLATMSEPPGPLSPPTTWPALTALATTQAFAPETLNTTLFVLLGTLPPVQFALSTHNPVPDGLAAGFQTVVVSCARALVAPQRRPPAASRTRECVRSFIMCRSSRVV